MKETVNIKAETLKIGKKKAMFKMIQRDEVPMGYYVSEIVGISLNTMKKGKRVLEVCYKIEEAQQTDLREGRALPEGYKEKYLYIKEVYIEGRYGYRYFKHAMESVLEKSEFQLPELLGVKEFIEIIFYDNNQIGTIGARTPYFTGFFDNVWSLSSVFTDYFE